MWNERRDDILKNDVYRARKSIEVFQQIGFKITGTGRCVNLMSYSDERKDIDDFMIDKREVALIPNTINEILNKIGLQVAFFDFMYENP